MVITTVLYNGDHPVIKRGWNMAYLVIRSMIFPADVPASQI